MFQLYKSFSVELILDPRGYPGPKAQSQMVGNGHKLHG